MAQLIVRNLEDDVRDRLKALAQAHGRSMEEEVREILRAAVLGSGEGVGPGLGTRLVEHFRGCDLAQGEVPELRGSPARPAELEP